jgi:hypothetical protein
MAMALPPALPLDLRRDAERLFDLSMWCLGQDVTCPDGNLLLRRGLIRERPPEGQQGNSVYTAALPGGGLLKLWGFGVLCDDSQEAVYIPRDGFTPRLMDVASVPWPVFRAEGLGASREPVTFEERRACRFAVMTVAEWLARHEEWVAAQVGLGWRTACFAGRRKAPPVRVEELAAAWWRIATRTRALEFVVNDFTAPAVGA